VLRAKIDMASPNIHMRDPVIYRIKKADHHRTGVSRRPTLDGVTASLDTFDLFRWRFGGGFWGLQGGCRGRLVAVQDPGYRRVRAGFSVGVAGGV
jgi:hypothetical protein